jgi:tetratricopeptide (TPR) repeat protein
VALDYSGAVMSWERFLYALPLGWLCLVLGCSPSGPGAADEEKEPQFLVGRSRVNSMDYRGAIEAFEQALETNPRSGAAHFELGWLYAEKESDPAAAIYHYETYLKLRPGAGNAETVRQHIFRLKQELAKGVLPLPPSLEIQRQLEQLAEENRRLHEELDRLRSLPPTSPLPNSSPAATTTTRSNPSATARSTVTSGAAGGANPRASRSTVARTHQVQPGETPAAIARRYNIRTEALLAANPGLNPRRMQVGQKLSIPNP